MSLQQVVEKAQRAACPLDEDAQHALLTLAQHSRASVDALVRRADVTPSVLARIVDHGAADPFRHTVRAAATHPACPLAAVVELVATATVLPTYLWKRDDLPRDIVAKLVDAAADPDELRRLADRPWLDPADADVLLLRALALLDDDAPDLDGVYGTELQPAQDAATTLVHAFPTVAAAAAAARGRAGAPRMVTAMLLTSTVVGLLDRDARDLLARHLILDELARLAARRSSRLPDHLDHHLYYTRELLDYRHRREVADHLARIDLTRCGRRAFLAKTYLETAADADPLDGVATAADLAGLVTDYLPDAHVDAILASPLCTTDVAVALVDCGDRVRARAVLAARGDDPAVASAVLRRFPGRLGEVAEAVGRDAGELALEALRGLLDGDPTTRRQQLDRAVAAWAPALATVVDRLRLDELAVVVGADAHLDAVAVARLVGLVDGPLAADTAVAIAGGWSGTFAQLTDTAAALQRPPDGAATG